jgi:hypothetical protein
MSLLDVVDVLLKLRGDRKRQKKEHSETIPSARKKELLLRMAQHLPELTLDQIVDRAELEVMGAYEMKDRRGVYRKDEDALGEDKQRVVVVIEAAGEPVTINEIMFMVDSGYRRVKTAINALLIEDAIVKSSVPRKNNIGQIMRDGYSLRVSGEF